MSVLIFSNSALYTTSKVAGTTIRRWIINSLAKALMNRHGEQEKSPVSTSDLGKIERRLPRNLSIETLRLSGGQVGQLEVLLDELQLAYHFGFFQSLDVINKFCIKRDPVDRFISCASQKIGKEKFSQIESVSHLLDQYKELCIEPIMKSVPKFSYNQCIPEWDKLVVARHFVPQHYSFGHDPNYYSRVFDISEVNSDVRPIIESAFGFQLEPLTANQATKKKLQLTESEVARVREVYAKDYSLGYC